MTRPTQTGKSLLAVLATALIAAMMAIASMTTVGSDSGDGSEACNFGEICLHDWTWSDRYRKHFWWSANNAGYSWWDAVANRYVGQLKNDADTVRNRDSSCSITIFEDEGQWPDLGFTVPNDGLNYRLNAVTFNRNDRHTRCYIPGGF